MAQVEKKYDSPATKKYSCTIELSDINEKTDAELLKIAENTEIKGFRKGKAPLKTVKEMYFAKAYNAAIDTTIRDTIEKIVKENDFKLSAPPSIEMDEEEKEKIAFLVTFELLPEMPSEFDYSQIKIKTYETAITEEDLAKELDTIASKNRTFTTKEGKAEKGDIVVIDAIGRVNGVEFAGGKLEGHELELGSGTFIPGFEDQLIGSSAGEDVLVTVSFPTDYHAKDLAGKEAQFFTKVKEIKKGEKAEVNEELAKKLSYEDLNTLKEDVQGRIESFYQNAHKEHLKEEVFDAISKALAFGVSENMVEKVAKSLAEEKKLPEEEAANLKEEAERRLRLSFFLNHIASQEKIEVTEQDFTNFILESANEAGMNPFAMLEFYNKNKEAKRKLQILLEESKIYDFIFSRITLEKERVSKAQFDEILGIKK